MTRPQTEETPEPLERVILCEHCAGPGAEVGRFSDAHIDLVECVEALRDQVRMLTRRVAELEQQRDE